MSFFRPYKYKDVEGVDRDAPPKHPLIVFFEIYFRKFFRFVTLNAMYFIITLPALLYFYLIFNGYALRILGDEFTDLMPGVGFFAGLVVSLPRAVQIGALIISVLLYGPAKMGMTYMLRNFAREEHAWTSDFFARAKANLKQGLFFGIADFLIVLLLLNNIFADYSGSEGAAATLLSISRYISAVAFVLYLLMRRYTYVMAVTIELNAASIYKNALLFAVVGLGRNAATLVASAAVWALTLFVHPVLTLLMLPLLTYSLCGFTTVYWSYPLIDKHLIKPVMEKDL